MELKSILIDERIEAANVLIELSISQYLSVAPSVIDKNEYQRKKVIKSKIKEILREDLLKGCSIPPIVLSTKGEELGDNFDYKNFNDISIIEKSFQDKTLLIIDGLQRTYVMLDLYETINKEIEKLKKITEGNNNVQIEEQQAKLDRFLSNKIRAEVYVGLNRLGILYRMITLNTGQTTMSTRHLMEILYFDYRGTGIENISFVTDKDEEVVRPNTTEYKFKDALDGFNSYIEKDENLIDRTEILDNIRTLNNLSDEDYKKDLFKSFMIAYKSFLDKIIASSNDWKYEKEDFTGPEYTLKSNPFGKTPLEIFKKSQAFTGFGGAIGQLKKNQDSITIEEVSVLISQIKTFEGDFQDSFKLILKHLDIIKEKSKKIGNDQRFYFRYLFQKLFDPQNEDRLNLDKAAEAAFDRTRIDKLS